MRQWYSSAAVAFTVLWLLTGVSGAFAADGSLEYPIKATFLQKFGDFVTWPPVAFEGTSSFTICVLGEDPFGPVLDRALDGHSLDSRPMTARRINAIAETAGCQILYIGRTNAAEAVLEGVKGRPILTVTDEETSRTPGVIHFMLRDNRVRFAIDDAAAAANGLGISSKLLSIAVAVNPRPRGTP